MTISKTVMSISLDADPALQSANQTTEDEINRVITEVNRLITSGTGVPTSSSPLGALYVRTDGSGTSNRLYFNFDGGTTWIAIRTVT